MVQGMPVTFSGIDRLIYVDSATVAVDVKGDIYSRWKEWVADSAGNQKWPEAISSIGGEPISQSEFVGSTFFLENGWRIKPWETGTGYVLNIQGNLFTREAGENPSRPTGNVTVVFTRSSLVTTISPDAGTATISQADKDAITSGVWKEQTITPDAGSYGELVQNMDSDLTIVKTDVDDTLKKGEFLALK